ncbi:MAG: C4-type zinc ribbon domain-containing protein [bacterium]
MANDLELLLQLQVIDYDLGELERSKEYLPDMMHNLKREIETAKKSYEEARQELEEGKLKLKGFELELATKEGELQRYQQKMMSIKTNKEYDALVAEIDAVKETISNAESVALEVIERVQKLETEIVDLEKKATEIEAKNGQQLQVLQKKIDSIGDKVHGKEEERTSVSSQIPRRTLSTYERVRKGKGGTAVVVVKKRACGSCYKALTPQKVQEIKRGDRIYTCENCGSLLFWKDDQSN